MYKHDLEELSRLIHLRERDEIMPHEFVSQVRDCLCDFQDFDSHKKDLLDTLIWLRTSDTFADSDFGMLLQHYLWRCRDKQNEEVLETLSSHSDDRIRAVVSWFQNYYRLWAQTTDFDNLRRTSPLQPGTRLRLFGGYTSAYASPWWLNGKEYHDATFVSFVSSRVGSAPKALAELDEELRLTGVDHSEHAGRYVILTGRHCCSYPDPVTFSWNGGEDISVCLCSTPPTDAEVLSSCINLYKEVETHAQYEIVDTKIAVGQTPLWAVAKEMARLVDELDDESTADDAGRLLGTMLACTPSLLLAVLPSLIPRLVRSGRMGAIIRALLRDCRTPALRALVASLSCEDPLLKTQIVQTIGQFGEEAKEVLPVLIAGLSCEDPMPRGQIAQAIGQLGREAKEALPALEPLLHDESSVRLKAAMAIWRIDARIAGIAPIIVEGLRCAELSREAGNCLREMGPDAAEVVPALVQLLISGKQSWERANAAVALGGMGLEAVVGIPALMSAIEDANDEVHWSAFGALRELRALARTGELVLQGFEVR